MLRDVLSQAYEAMLHNRRRTLITMIGMAWGIATVVLLMAYGAGFGRAIEAIFAQFGTNLMGAFPGTTSQQAGGKKAGVPIKFQLTDVDLLQNNVPGLIHIVPEVSKDVSIQNDTHSYTWSVSGSYPAVADVQKLDLDYGRF
jgi:putative ABC transport system permease protein